MNFQELYRKIEAIDKGEPVEEGLPLVAAGIGLAGAAGAAYKALTKKAPQQGQQGQQGISGAPPNPTGEKPDTTVGGAVDAIKRRQELLKNLEEEPMDDDENERAEVLAKLQNAAAVIQQTAETISELMKEQWDIADISNDAYRAIVEMIQSLSQDYDFSDVMEEHSVGEATAYAKRGITASPKRKSQGFDDTADWVDDPYVSRDIRLAARAEKTGSPTRLTSRDSLDKANQADGDDLKTAIQRRTGTDYYGKLKTQRTGQKAGDYAKKINLPEQAEEELDECGEIGPMSPMGAMPPPKQQDNVNMNVSLNAAGGGGIRDLLDILKNLDQSGQDDMEMPVAIKSMGALIDDDFGNSPEEKYYPQAAMFQTGGDIHSKGGEAGKVNGGGNPLQLQAQLESLYQQIKLREGSGPKEKAHSKYVDRNSAESKSKVQAAKDKMASDKKAEPGKNLLSKIKSK